MITHYKVDEILDLLGLRGVKKDSNGWRAQSPFCEANGDNPALSINAAGLFKCHKTEKSGNILHLYGHVKGIPDIARVVGELREKGLISVDDSTTRNEEEFSSEKITEYRAVDKAVEDLDFIFNCDDVADWRGIPKEVFEDLGIIQHFGFKKAWEKLGSAYCFICTSPPVGVVPKEDRAIHARSVFRERKGDWRAVGSYPIWVPAWNKDVSEVWLTEGGWDAITLQMMLEIFDKELSSRIQVMALSGPKNIGDHPEVMDYFRGKIVVQIPDVDKPGEDGTVRGEKIFIKTAQALSRVRCVHKILRLPATKRSSCKDINDWWKTGPTNQHFNIWKDSIDSFMIAGPPGKEIVVDSEYRETHGVSADAIIDIGPEGNPIEILTQKPGLSESISKEDVLELIKPFPIIHKYVLGASKGSEAPLMWQLMIFLTFVSSVIGRRFRYKTNLYANIYTLLIGPSSLGKSTSIGALVAIVSKLLPDLYMPDAMSFESMVDKLAINSHRMMTINEISNWIGGKNADYRIFVTNAFNELYDTDRFDDKPYQISYRKTGDKAIIEPYFTMLAGGTATNFKRLSDHELHGGLIGRFLYVWGKKKHDRIEDAMGLSTELKKDISDFFSGILNTPCREDQFMRWSDQAQKMYKKCYNEHCDNQESSVHGDSAMTYTGRWKVQIIKTAMCLEVCRPGRTWPLDSNEIIISEASFFAAYRIVKILHEDFMGVFAEKFIEQHEETMEDKFQARIIKALTDHACKEGVPARLLYRLVSTTKFKFDQNMDALIEAGRVICKKIPNKTNHKISAHYWLVKESNILKMEA